LFGLADLVKLVADPTVLGSILAAKVVAGNGVRPERPSTRECAASRVFGDRMRRRRSDHSNFSHATRDGPAMSAARASLQTTEAIPARRDTARARPLSALRICGDGGYIGRSEAASPAQVVIETHSDEPAA
jgi:hypothetical protein